LTQFIKSKKAFASEIKRLELIIVKKVKLKKDVSKDRLNVAYVNKIKPYKRFNTTAFIYTLTRLARFKDSLGAKKLRSSLTNFVKSAKKLNNKELSLFKYI
jgi:hypothetical protein